jgi:hypothetical protein
MARIRRGGGLTEAAFGGQPTQVRARRRRRNDLDPGGGIGRDGDRFGESLASFG